MVPRLAMLANLSLPGRCRTTKRRMRALLPVALALVCTAPTLGCDQDYAASNANRETFMGDAQAAPPPIQASATPPPPAPVAPPAPPAPAPSASAAPSAAGSAAPPAHSAVAPAPSH